MGMIKYIHGSEDSTDVDVFYAFNELPSKEECKKFCSADPTENRNIIVVKNGIVSACYKGTADECNNSLLRTYELHNQEFPLIIEHPVKRDITAKVVRAIRIILSNISRSHYRVQIKKALISPFVDRINVLKNIDCSTIDFSTLRHSMTREDILKVMAFQIGQTLALIKGKELYTKSEVAKMYPSLKQFLYRDKNSNLNDLNKALNEFLDCVVMTITYDGYNVSDGATAYNIMTEEKIYEKHDC